MTALGQRTPTYPFTALVGADELTTALLLSAISPEIGGVLVRGEKGTAKSTAVRALAAVLPEQHVALGCRFGCDPDRAEDCPDGPHDGPGTTRPARLVELPVGATEDRVVGSLDLRRALGEGEAAYQPGLLAEAHRGILYVDEVNLLHDHLVDVLLDAAAMGRNTVERDGVSISHPARITLVGTMNPEEGELRPQLLDRFGLTVHVAASRDPRERAEVVRRRLAADSDPVGFAAGYERSEAELTERIAAARAGVREVVLDERTLRTVARVCAGFDVDGLRADIVTARTAVAHAAWHGRTHVTREDIRAAALLALPHRRRRSPFDAPGLDEDLLDRLLDEEPEDDPPGGDEPEDGPTSRPTAAGPTSSSATATAEPPAGRPPPPTGPTTPRRPGVPTPLLTRASRTTAVRTSRPQRQTTPRPPALPPHLSGRRAPRRPTAHAASSSPVSGPVPRAAAPPLSPRAAGSSARTRPARSRRARRCTSPPRCAPPPHDVPLAPARPASPVTTCATP
ncbi:ATP-binding protein [Janibacter melonis]|uniref:ATP-binding protein n=1 Tax=Janibacter melonis TaxID=262209 RepID=UPI002094E2CC|nr:ATP-binding protein [Janibacter melonis]